MCVCCRCASSTLLRYGAGEARKQVYLLYTGQHYDPLVGPAPRFERAFPPAHASAQPAEAREAAARRIAKQHNEEAQRLARERSLPVGTVGGLLREVERVNLGDT